MRTVGLWITGALSALAMSSFTAAALGATGLEPGVHIDPGSPAAKEYSLRLNEARQIGAGSGSQGSSESTLFGRGIKPPGTAGRSRAGSGAAPAGRSRAGAPALSSPAAAAAALHAADAVGGSSGEGSALVIVAGGVAIVVLAGFGGTVLRHSRRPGPPA